MTDPAVTPTFPADPPAWPTAYIHVYPDGPAVYRLDIGGPGAADVNWGMIQIGAPAVGVPVHAKVTTSTDLVHLEWPAQ